ncbi:MAG TPA: hypothetical protein VJB82_03780 [Candidatus Peribacterales bacterium]|nr:hypothetical protein [Candidatus Peribacterales bacterium]
MSIIAQQTKDLSAPQMRVDGTRPETTVNGTDSNRESEQAEQMRISLEKELADSRAHLGSSVLGLHH